MSSSDWLAKGWITVQRSSPEEIADLLMVCDRELKDSRIQELSYDAQLSLAYNGALQCAIAGLRSMGYRLGRERHHERAIESLQWTLKLSGDVVNELQAFRRKRNMSDYDAAGRVSKQEAARMHALTEEIRSHLVAWLRQHHKPLLSVYKGSP